MTTEPIATKLSAPMAIRSRYPTAETDEAMGADLRSAADHGSRRDMRAVSDANVMLDNDAGIDDTVIP